MQHEPDPPAVVVAPQPLGPGRAREAVVELDARPQPRERFVRGPALDERVVGLGNLEARMRDAVREIAVGREQQQAFAVAIEPPDMTQAGRGPW